MSDEMISRAVRAFSRARVKQDRIELGFFWSNVRNLQHVVAGGLAISAKEQFVVARRVDQRAPLVAQFLAQIEREVVIDVDETGHVLGPLDVLRHPKDRVRHPAEHKASPSTGGHCRWRRAGQVFGLPLLASTQVSLLPPPCELLTIIEPRRRATRVSPPGNT